MLGEHIKLRKELNISEDAFVLIFVGKFIDIKRPLDVVKAVNKLLDSQNIADFHVIFVGDGPLKRKLIENSQENKNNFHFVGFINQNDLSKYYAASNCLILSSDNETWGLVVNEAFACGIPAIVSNQVGCAPELIINGKTGYVYPVGDINSLAEKILKMKNLLDIDKENTKSYLLNKIGDYSINKATSGLMEALDAVSN